MPEPLWVLIVEDEPDLSLILEEGLTNAGYRVVLAGNAPDAIRKLINQAFDCILLDIRLSRGNGEQVIESVRNQPGFNKDTPILVMSGLLEQDLVVRIRGKVNDILVKPFNFTTLQDKIRKLTKS